MKTLVDNFSRRSSSFLARQILDTTHTFRVTKNWNSHGGQLGASLCQLGSILASFENAAKKPLVSNHFGEVIPQCCVQTDAKHGNHDVTYVEYMCAAVERRMIIGGQESYLNHIKFRRDNHAEGGEMVLGRVQGMLWRGNVDVGGLIKDSEGELQVNIKGVTMMYVKWRVVGPKFHHKYLKYNIKLF